METKQIISKDSYSEIHHDLVEGCRKGDQRAQFRIYKLYYKAMYNTCLSIVKDPMEAEDIMQESFLAAFEKIGSFSGTVSFGAWLKSIVRNHAINSLRASQKMKYAEMSEYAEAIHDDAVFTDSVAGEPDTRYSRLMDALKKLPEGWRTVFSLYFIEGYDHEEISEILSIAECTSRSQLSRARKKIVSEYQKL